MATKTTTTAVVLTVALLVVATSQVAEGQSTDCVSKLVQCAQYLNTTGTPGSDCCTAIKSVVETELDCLCKIYNQPGGLSAFGIDVNQALALPKRCGLPNDVSTCKAFAPGSSIVPPPPGAPDKGNAVDRISWIGMPALLLVSSTIFLS
ncbi:non-specific lipid transfer protein GPI-anchored 7-like isoform X1 [Primulina tabacum]|uniref:non-specific lipid transfer protein GPI-anchored 7-like isoform X1 n=1 Tax=Primulina tabacum TaxID=48773 RepID=UPI003F5A1195